MKKHKAKLPQVLNVSLPKKWEDLTASQVMRVAYYLSMEPSEAMFLVLIGVEFADLKPRGHTVMPDGEICYKYYHRKEGNVILSSAQITAIAEALKWMLAEPGPMEAPELNGYRMPDSRLYGIGLEQFVTADAACMAFIMSDAQNSGDSRLEILRFMVAALYPRKKFDPERLDEDARRLKYLPEWQLSAVLMWFSGVKKWIMEKYPYVFSSDGGGTGPKNGADMLSVLLSGVNEGRVADNGILKTTDIHEILFELNEKIKNSKKDK